MSYVPAKKNTAYIFYVGLVSRSTGQFQANPTLAAGDFKVSIDGGALNNLGTLPTVTPAASKMVKVSLSAAEMNGDNITIVGSDAVGAEWDDVIVNIQTSTLQIDDLATAAALAVVQADTDDIQSRLPASLTAGGNIKADALAISGDTIAADNFETMLDGTGGKVLSLKQLNIVNNTGTALIASSTGGDGSAAEFTSNGDGSAVVITTPIGGAGNAVYIVGDLGNGMKITSTGNDAVNIGSTSFAGLYVHGGQFGIEAEGNIGINSYGIAGDAIHLESLGSNGHGINSIGFGTGKSINAAQDIALPSGDLDDQLQALPTAAENADAVWDEATAGHTTAGTTGKALIDAGSAGDPWSTSLPGAYTFGQAGYILASRMPTGTVIVAQNNDKTGYSLSSPQVFDLIGNVSGTMTNVVNVINPVVAGVVTGSVLGNVNGSVGSVVNPVGIATGTFLDAMADKVWSYVNRTLTVFGFGVTVTTNNDKTGYSLSSPQNFNLNGNINGYVGWVTGSVNSVVNPVGISTGSFINAVADQVWDETLTDHLDAGSTGNALNAAGAAGDPWATMLPGAYGAGTAGDIIGNKLDMPISDIPTANENADALLKRDWTAVVGEASRSVLNALRKLRNKVSFDGANTLTVTKEDDATPAYTQGVVEDANQDPFKEVG